MIDPTMFRQVSEIMHEERLEHYTRRRQPRAEQPATQATALQQVQGAWRALLARVSFATGR